MLALRWASRLPREGGEVGSELCGPREPVVAAVSDLVRDSKSCTADIVVVTRTELSSFPIVLELYQVQETVEFAPRGQR